MQRRATSAPAWGSLTRCSGGRMVVRGALAPHHSNCGGTRTWLRSPRNTSAREAAPSGELGPASASSALALLAAAASPPGWPPHPSRFCRPPGHLKHAASCSLTTASTSGEPSSSQSNIPVDLLLGDVRLVLVQPKHEANIGAAARAAANFECVDLVVVAPRCAPGWREGEAGKVAVGGGSAIVLGRARVVDSLEEALADTAGSIGFTRRAGAARLVHASMGHLAAEFPWALSGVSGGDDPSARGRAPLTALVFGREESGLTEAELRLCSHACAIPTGRLQPSMNLSHAVSVVLADLFARRSGMLAAGPVPASSAAGSGLHLGESMPSTADAEGAQPASSNRLEPASKHSVGLDAEVSAGGGTAASSSEGGASAAAGRLALAGLGGGSASADSGLQPASAREVELLLEKAAAVAGAVGISPEEGRGGGGNHGRRRLPIGHLRAVLARARLTAAESSSLHGLASAVLQRLDPEHPLEARKAANKQRQDQRFKERQERRRAEEEQARTKALAGGQAQAQEQGQGQEVQQGQSAF